MGRLVAFGLRLIHGFGSASVLRDLGLPRPNLVQALVGFNLGVEAGQLAIVLVFLPIAYGLRQAPAYRVWGLTAGSGMAAILAGAWVCQRW